MKTLEEVKEAIRNFADKEVWKLGEWLDEQKNERWDAEMQRDAASGRLDKLAKESTKEYEASRYTEAGSVPCREGQHMGGMKEIREAIAQLPRKDVRRLREWMEELEADLWDRQIEEDFKTGVWDEAAERASKNFEEGRYREL